MENNLIPFNNKSNAEILIMINQLNALSLSRLNEKIEAHDKMLEQLNEHVSIVEEENHKTLETAVNSMRVKSLQDGYMTQKVFGTQFTISIGAKTVGKLFKAMGLAQHISNTTPYRQFIPKYGKPMANEKYSAFVWNYENCLNFLDKWLAEEGYYENFYSQHTEKELTKFIDDLYSIYLQKEEI